MKSTILIITAVLTVFSASQVFANSAPTVSNVSAFQRGDDSKLVDIYYNLSDADGDNCTIWVVVSDDGGLTWRVPVDNFTGAVGPSITPGTNKHIVWDAGQDCPGKSGSFKVRVWADDGNGQDSMVAVPAGWFAYQNAAPENYIFVDNFAINKYEVSVQQYCQFLNSADPDGTYWYTNQEIIRKGDPGNYYYEVQAGRENYPIRYVSFYDAEAYAVWKSNQTGLTYRLPTEQEWEKAAGWDPVLQKLWAYGFHQDTISCSWCNYISCYGGPLPVGSFNGTGGKEDARSYYGCYDMSGNVWEWTSSIYSGSGRVIRGGYWDIGASYCAVTYRTYNSPSNRGYIMGFRLVLDF